MTSNLEILFKSARNYAESEDPNDKLFGLAIFKQLYTFGRKLAELCPENKAELEQGLKVLREYVESL